MPHSSKKARHLLGFFTFLLLGVQCTQDPSWVQMHGYTMGTTYSITVELAGQHTSKELQAGIDSVLTEINRQMSTYISNSEISQFNALKAGESLTISPEFAQVLVLSKSVWELTQGAFDVTVYPLVKLWGFGPESGSDWVPPTPEQVQVVKTQTGFQYIDITGRQLKKLREGLSLDLNAIAKGFGVDQVAQFLDTQGVVNYLVEIGGEIRCRGWNQQGKAWIIGIDRPVAGSAPGDALESVIHVSNEAVATSGDYRAFHYYQGKQYSHAINPRTGYPMENGVASATVVAPTCAFADALATALMIMGEEDGLQLVESLPDVEVLLVIRTDADEFRERLSSGMKALFR